MTSDVTTWTVTLETDPANPDDLILPLPQDLLDMQGWAEGDTLIWAQVDDGRWSLTKRAVT